MQLELTVLRCPDTVAPEARTVTGGEFSVGRGPGVDWVLPDPERLLSKRHFALAFRAGTWQLADTSTNGTFLNTEDTAVGPGEVRTLRDGDRVRVGAYEIEVRLTEDARRYGGSGSGFGVGSHGNAEPFGDPFGMDPLAPPPPARQPFGGHVATHNEVAPILPDDFDLLGPEPLGRPSAAPFATPVQSDHSSVMQDAYQPPRAAGQVPLHTGKTIPGDNLLPDDWDNDLLEGIGTPAAPPPIPAPPITAPRPTPPIAPPKIQPPVAWEPVAPEPVVPQPVIRPTAAPVVRPLPPVHLPRPDAAPMPLEDNASPFDEPDDLINGPHRLDPPIASVVAPRIEPPPPAATRPLPPIFDEPDAPPPVAAQPVAPPVARQAAESQPRQPPPSNSYATDGTLLTAFLEGAGLTEVRPADPEATMRALGAAFRTMVSGLRGVLIARASIKSEFRIEQTMIRARGNNPLKFSAGDDDALSALLGTGRRVDMAPAAAVADALSDIRLHELASMAAMQSAVRALMEGLDPAKLRAAADQAGGMTVLPAQRKARAWDAFEALHTKTTQALSDDFDSVFGKAFARAYERAMDDISAKERE